MILSEDSTVKNPLHSASCPAWLQQSDHTRDQLHLIQNWELPGRLSVLGGSAPKEFTKKLSSPRLSVYLSYHF